MSETIQPQDAQPQDAKTAAAPPAKDHAWIVAKHILVLLVLGALFWYQSAKLNRMEHTREVLRTLSPGEIDVKNVILTRKWDVLQNGTDHDTVDIALGTSPRDFWVSWEKPGEWATTNRRMEIPKTNWDALRVGGPMEVIYVKGDSTPYLRSEIHTEIDDEITDRRLMWIWKIGIALTLLSLPLCLFVDWSFLADEEKPEAESIDANAQPSANVSREEST